MTLDMNTIMMISFALLLLIPFVKQAKLAIKAKRDRGNLVKIHEGTSYERLMKLQPDKKGRPSRRSLWKRPAELPAVVITFDGNIQAKGHELFGQLADEVIENKASIAEVVVRVTSPGGSVPPYGLLYAHMERMRNSGISLTSAVDTFGASGGYMMVAPSTKIVASPLAIIASIGVVMQMLNFNKLLTAMHITPIIVTAGDHKRTLTPTGEVTDEHIEFTKTKLAVFHRIFIAMVQKYRPQVDISVCDGDSWSALESVQKNMGLVDELMTSREYIGNLNKERDVVFLSAKSVKFGTPFGNYREGIFANFVASVMTKLGTSLVDRIVAKLTSNGLDF